LTRASVLGQQSWSAARKNDDFPAFRPHLERILQLKREEAQAIGFETCAYDVLLDDYEPDGRRSAVSAECADEGG